MPYIYKITNKINHKVYIGKTLCTVQKRWSEHCNDYKKERCEKRPLYAAMNKYGIDNFYIEEVEECDENILSEREKYWIEYYGSFKNGYNATIGGDGTQYIDYDVVVNTYKNTKSQRKTAIELGISPDTVKKIIDLRNENQFPTGASYVKGVNMLDMNGNFVKTFSSITDASQYLIDFFLYKGKIPTLRKHISEVCKGKRKSAYNFFWQYA